MKIHIHESEIGPQAGGLADRQGQRRPPTVFCMGVSHYASTEYGKPGIHDDQEGFYILQGTGTAKVGDEEFAVSPGSAFIANKGVPHTMKRDAASKLHQGSMVPRSGLKDMSKRSSRKLRIAVAGLGRIGWHFHCKTLGHHEDWQLAAVADPAEERRREAEQTYGCRAFERFEDMLEQADLSTR